MDYNQLSRSALIRLLQEYDAANRDAGKDGIVMSYMGRTAPWQIIRMVKPKLHRILKRYSVGEESEQAMNELWDGENLSTMVTLYKHRGQVDLIVTDGNSIAAGKVAKQEVELTSLSGKLAETTWEVQGHTNPVRLRWLIGTALRARSTRALAVTDLQDPKFDVRVQVQSIANKQAEAVAREIVSAYYQHSELVYASESKFLFGSIRVPQNAPTFKNSLYDQYGGLNKFELPFAEALDESGFTWHRNSSAGGFHIPLLTEGDTGAFYPDFIVWKGNLVYCLDTKGQHLLTDAIARKLFDIHEDGKIKLHVRFISEGKQTVIGGKAIAGGYTVWKMKAGAVTPVYVTSMAKAVGECLK